jgi:4-oxalocrotonate tautomerase
MPMIKVELLKGRSIEQKREFVEVVAREAARILKCAPDAIDIIFSEVEPEDWAVGGKLTADKKL